MAVHRIRVRLHANELEMLRELSEEQRETFTVIMRKALKLYAAERPAAPIRRAMLRKAGGEPLEPDLTSEANLR